jgi:hypothetical protein
MSKELLIVGSYENRLRYFDNDPEYDDLPKLGLSEELTDESNNDEISDFERYKEDIFNIISNNIKYSSVDPSYINDIKDISKNDERYICHIRSLFGELSDDKKYDYILITSCYQNFFVENIDKIKKLIKEDGIIIVLYGVPYHSFNAIINEHFNHIDDYNTYNFKKLIFYELKNRLI